MCPMGFSLLDIPVTSQGRRRAFGPDGPRYGTECTITGRSPIFLSQLLYPVFKYGNVYKIWTIFSTSNQVRPERVLSECKPSYDRYCFRVQNSDALIDQTDSELKKPGGKIFVVPKKSRRDETANRWISWHASCSCTANSVRF
jgi:hypothetical protein